MPSVEKVFIRGCPGQGTHWFSRAATCLFVGAITISEDLKHHGCHIGSATDALLPHKLAHPDCKPHNCIHAVISRHPMELKRGRPGANLVWEAYYGAWARSNISNVRFFRYEDVVREGCTAAQANTELVQKYFERTHRCVDIHDRFAWTFWNYTNDDCQAETGPKLLRGNGILRGGGKSSVTGRSSSRHVKKQHEQASRQRIKQKVATVNPLRGDD